MAFSSTALDLLSAAADHVTRDKAPLRARLTYAKVRWLTKLRMSDFDPDIQADLTKLRAGMAPSVTPRQLEDAAQLLLSVRERYANLKHANLKPRL